MNEEEKLVLFERSVYDDVKIKADKIKADAEQQAQMIVKEAEQRAERVKWQTLTAGKKEIDRQYKSVALNASLDSKRKLITRREELTDALFAKVRKRLSDFVKTEQYADYLRKSIESARAVSGADFTVEARSEDEKAVLDICGVKPVFACDIKIGGIRVVFPSEHIMVDLTLDEKILEARKKFTYNKSLVIK